MFAKGVLTVSAFAAVTASATYAYTVHQATRCTDARRLVREFTVPDSLRNSKSVKKIIDPLGFSLVFDTRSIKISIPPHRLGVSDEELLSRFTKAFFGGAVIRPERTVLRKLKWNLVNFSAIDSSNTTQVWDVEQIPETSFLPLHAKIFGAFQVLDSKKFPTSDSSNGDESYIDIGFGKDQSSFAGIHRFSASRPTGEGSETQNQVVLQFSCQVASCQRPNFAATILPYSGFFHLLYADLLFRESIGEVERWLQGHG